MQKTFYRSFYAPGAGTAKRYEVNDLPSQTIQNETFSIADLLKREIQGQAIRRAVSHMEVENIDQVDSRFRPPIDLTDVDANRERIASTDARLKEQIAESKAKAENAKKAKELKDDSKQEPKKEE